MFTGEKNILIVHYNTPELTSALIKSINKFTPGCKIYLFDNSNKFPFPATPGVTILDNTKGQLINFEEKLKNYPNKLPTHNKWGSTKHTLTVDYMFDVLKNGFVLLDSDILLKQDITPFFDRFYICAGSTSPTEIKSCKKYTPEVFDDKCINCVKKDKNLCKFIVHPRLRPYICWINVPMCRQLGIRYFDDRRMWKLFYGEHQYDTGSSFLEDCINSHKPIKMFRIKNYIEHLNNGSMRENGWKQWLEQYKEYYE